jgi:hypothetical protein
MNFSLKQADASLATAPQYLSIVEASDPFFRDLWLEFLSFLPQYGFRYAPTVIEYYHLLAPPSTKNAGFIIKSNNTPIAICSLTIEEINGRIQASLAGGGYLPAPLLHPGFSNKQKRSIEEIIFEEVAKRLREARATRWLVEADILSVGTDVLEDLLPARFGALDISAQIHILDLTQSKEDLWSEIRHSAKSTINQGLKIYEFKVYDKNNYTAEIGDRHRLLHHKCSGKITRPIETFYKMYSWIEEGCGLMFEQLYQGKTVQMIFVALGKHTASGASAADDPDFYPKIPLTHSMNFFIYQETAKRGVKYYEVGDTTFRDSLFNMRSPKEKTICDFKRGFGRNTFPFKRWIWFTDINEELTYLTERIEAYKKHLMIN